MKAKEIFESFRDKLKWLLTPHSPIRTLGTIAIAVYIGETLVMFILAILPPLPMLTEAFLDSTLLIVVISPALYLFLFRPIIRHIEQRENAESKLRKNRDLLQIVFNGISDPLILLDDQMNVKMINTAASRYYRLGDQFSVDQPCHIALMKGAKQCEECDIPKRIAEKGNFNFERSGLLDDSRIERVHIYRSPGNSDHTGAIIVKIMDVTEEKAMERQLRQRERLISLGLLISGVAHEINNPNTFISFNLPILSEYLKEMMPIIDQYASRHSDFEIANMPYTEFRRDLFKLIDNITHGSGRINTIVSQLKEFSRIQESNNVKPVDVKTLIDKVIALADAQIKKSVKRFKIDIPNDLPMIATEAQAIEQITLNLLINACQAADKTDSWAGIKIRPSATNPIALKIEFSDNGCGMDDKTIKHIFDPLFTTKGPDSGTGLGLYICHNLAERIRGTIEVSSIPGQGSTFTVLIPDLTRESHDVGIEENK